MEEAPRGSSRFVSATELRPPSGFVSIEIANLRQSGFVSQHRRVRGLGFRLAASALDGAVDDVGGRSETEPDDVADRTTAETKRNEAPTTGGRDET